jgi:hypothetical protein
VRQLGLPAAHLGWGDLVDRPVGEPGKHMLPQPAFGGGEGGGAGVVGRPCFPPLVGPMAERQPAALASSPGATAHLQAFLGGEVAGLVGGVDGLAALGAVIHSPGDQVAVAALAPAHRPHQGIPARKWRAALGERARCGVQGGRWRPLMAGCGSGSGREWLRPFSLDNVTAALPFMSGSPRCRHASQNPHNPQNLLPDEVLRVVRVVCWGAEG